MKGCKDREMLICKLVVMCVCMCTLWHCHWSSLASCSVMQTTDKDFIQLFLTHTHTHRTHTQPFVRLCMHAQKQYFMLSPCSLTATWLIYSSAASNFKQTVISCLNTDWCECTKYVQESVNQHFSEAELPSQFVDWHLWAHELRRG